MERNGYKKISSPTPEWVGKLWGKVYAVRDRFPWGVGKDLDSFVRVILAPNTAIYEIGDFAGLVFFTEIVGPDQAGRDAEPVAECHLFIWNSIYAYRRTEVFRQIMVDFFAEYRVHRVFAQIPASVRVNVGLVRRLGFNIVGTVRKRIPRGETWEDAFLADFLVDDLEVTNGCLGSPSDHGRSVSPIGELGQEGAEGRG